MKAQAAPDHQEDMLETRILHVSPDKKEETVLIKAQVAPDQQEDLLETRILDVLTNREVCATALANDDFEQACVVAIESRDPILMIQFLRNEIALASNPASSFYWTRLYPATQRSLLKTTTTLLQSPQYADHILLWLGEHVTKPFLLSQPNDVAAELQSALFQVSTAFGERGIYAAALHAQYLPA